MRPVGEVRAHEGSAWTQSGWQVAQIARSSERLGVTNLALVGKYGVSIAGHECGGRAIFEELSAPISGRPDLVLWVDYWCFTVSA